MRHRSAQRLLHTCLSHLRLHLLALRRRLPFLPSTPRRRRRHRAVYHPLRRVSPVTVPKGHVAVYVGAHVESLPPPFEDRATPNPDLIHLSRKHGKKQQQQQQDVVRSASAAASTLLKDESAMVMYSRETQGLLAPEQQILTVEEEEAVVERFVVPISYLRHQLFKELLKQAEQEFGFDPPPISYSHHHGDDDHFATADSDISPPPHMSSVQGLRLPCSVSHFRQTLHLIKSTHRPHRCLRLIHATRIKLCCTSQSRSSTPGQHKGGKLKWK